MNEFDSMADEDWQIRVDGFDLNEPSICYPDPDRRGGFVGPLAVVYVGATVELDGEEVLDMESADGRNLAAVACLPQMAQLFRWIIQAYSDLGVSENDEYNAFVDELIDRVQWIRNCIDFRPDMMNVGQHGFIRYPESSDGGSGA